MSSECRWVQNMKLGMKKKINSQDSNTRFSITNYPLIKTRLATIAEEGNFCNFSHDGSIFLPETLWSLYDTSPCKQVSYRS